MPRDGLARERLVAVGLALAATALAWLPEASVVPLRQAWRTAMHPGWVVAANVREQTASLANRLVERGQTAARIAALEAQSSALLRENLELRARIARAAPSGAADDPAAASLLLPRALPARVLGPLACDSLRRTLLCDVGSRELPTAGGLLLTTGATKWRATVDQGASSGLSPGHLALAGTVVWGQLCEVGPETSVARHVCDAAYRDVVWLVPRGRAPAAGVVSGVWQGTGEPEARVVQVDTSAAVSVGDGVYSAALQGVWPEPPRCGEVTRVERAADEPHWRIWARPDAALISTTDLAVVTSAANPARLAAQGGEPGAVQR
ncbi:MAG: hypothetical protein K1X74_01480 [Pirellulales bacterium]|nr:hypothetical protein [Pirellulales bacterium]